MKQDQDGECRERSKATIEQSREVIGNDNSIIGDAHNGQDQQDHDRAKASQGRTESEHVPSHHSSRSVHHKSKTRQINRGSLVGGFVFLGFMNSRIHNN